MRISGCRTLRLTGKRSSPGLTPTPGSASGLAWAQAHAQAYAGAGLGGITDEVGWKRNGMDSKDVFRIDRLPDKNKGKKIDRKILRKIRAEKIQQKSIELNPLKDQITSLEKSIKLLEDELVENNQQLVNASEKAPGMEIPGMGVPRRNVPLSIYLILSKKHIFCL